MQRSFFSIMIINFAFTLAFCSYGMENNQNNQNNLTFRLFTQEDRASSLALGLKYYLNRYDEASYLIVDYSDEKKYKELTPLQNQEKIINLISDGNKLFDSYLENQDKGFHAFVVLRDGESIGGLFYRVKKNGVLLIDEMVITTADREQIKEFILTKFLREKEPQSSTYKFFLRPINEEEMKFFKNHGYEDENPIETEKQGYDPKLYIGLTKTYPQPN